MKTIVPDAPKAQGGGAIAPISHTVAQQHFPPAADPATRIAALEERIAALELKVYGRTSAK